MHLHRFFFPLLAIFIAMPSQANDVIIRHNNPASMTEPWAREFAESIEVRGVADQILLSGVGPMVANKKAPADTVASYGNTEIQTLSVLSQIKHTLEQKGYTMADVISMQALIVGDPKKGGDADFEGFSNVYNRFFGTKEQPNVPIRTRAQVIRLVPPGWLVEVTVTAAKRKP